MKKERFLSPSAIAFASALLMISGSVPLLSAPKKETIAVDDPRPLAKVAELLESKLGVQINYEDGRYEFLDDTKDVTAAVIRPADQKAHPEKKVIIPKGGPLEVEIDVDDHGKAVTLPEAALQALIANHHGAGLPGKFKLDRHDNVFSLNPDQVKDIQGNVIQRGSVLNTQVTFPLQQRSGLETLQVILDQVSKASGYKIGLGMIPINFLAQSTVFAGANQEKAQDVLLRIFATAQWARTGIDAPLPRLSYQLFYEPGTRDYMFNAHVVSVEVDTPFGGKIRKPL